MTDVLESPMTKLTLDVLSSDEIRRFEEEMERIQDKYNTENEPCEFKILSGDEDPMGGMMVFLIANKPMIEAYITEQII